MGVYSGKSRSMDKYDHLSKYYFVSNPDKLFIMKHVNDCDCIKDFLNDAVRKYSHMFLDTKNNKIVCTFVVFDDKGHNILSNFEVNPEYRRQGIAKELLDYVVKVKKVNHLWVEKDNTIAKNLYLNYGFKPTGDAEGSRIYMEL